MINRSFFILLFLFFFSYSNLFGTIYDNATLISKVDEFNKYLSDITKYVQNQEFDKATNTAQILLKNIGDGELCYDFYSSIVEIKKKFPSYSSPLINQFPSALDYKNYQTQEDTIRDYYHKTIEELKEAEQNLAVKKYFTALKILITGFTTYKSMIDLIQDDINIKDLINLPDTLQNIVDTAKNDAENIAKKFETITDEKEKIEIIKNFKNKLVEFMHYIREIENYLRSSMDVFQQIQMYRDMCNNYIIYANNTSVPVEEPSHLEISKYVKSINNLKDQFIKGEIGISDYKTGKESIKNSVQKEYAAIEDPSDSDDEILEDFMKEYFEFQATINTYDENNNPISIDATTFDYNVLLNYQKIKNEFVKNKKDFIDKFNTLIDRIGNFDFLMLGDEYNRPVDVTPVSIKEEWDSILYGGTPNGCSSFFDNTSSMLPNSSLVSSDIDVCTVDKAPPLLSNDPNISNDMYLYNIVNNYLNNGQPLPLWYEMLGSYVDKLLDRAKLYWKVALTGYRSIPSCIAGNYCSYGLTLLDRDKVINLRNNIEILYDDMVKFPKDFDDMYSDFSNDNGSIKLLINQLFDLYKILISSKGTYISDKDLNFSLNLNLDDIFSMEVYKKILFFQRKDGKVNFINSYNLLDFIDEEIDFLKVKQDEIKESAESYETSFDTYLREIDETIDFNDSVENNKNSIIETIDELQNSGDYISYLKSIYDKISVINYLLKNEEISSIYNNAEQLKYFYDNFLKLPYVDIANNLNQLYRYLDLIKDGTGAYEQFRIFNGKYLVFPENKQIIDKFQNVIWPNCEIGRGDPIFLNFLTPEKISNGLKEVENLINIYTSDEYKPVEPKTKFLIAEAKVFPETINGTGEVTCYVKFNNVYNTINGKVYIEIHSGLPEDLFEITPAKGYNYIYKNYSRVDSFYTTMTNNEVKFTFKLLKDSQSIIGSTETIPIENVLIAVYALSTELPHAYYVGDEINAVTFNVVNLKFNKDKDENNNSIIDSWEEKYNLDTTTLNEDLDNDGIISKDEYFNGTNPLENDTDSDGIPDGVEIIYGMNPLNPDDSLIDSDKDGLTNGEEIIKGFNPDDPNSPSGGEIYPVITQITDDEVKVEIIMRILKTLNSGIFKISYSDSFELKNANNLTDLFDLDNNTMTITVNSQIQEGTYKIFELYFKQKENQFDNKFFSKIDVSNVNLDNFTGTKKEITLSQISKTSTVELNSGWNLISNVFNDNISTENFKNNSLKILWKWENSSWKIWSDNDEIVKLTEKYKIPLFSNISPLEGVWVYADEKTDINLKGYKLGYGFKNLNLNNGWTLAGSGEDIEINLFASQFPDIKTVWKWNENEWKVWSNIESIKEIINDYNLPMFSTIKKGEGFWVNK